VLASQYVYSVEPEPARAPLPSGSLEQA